MNRQEEKEKFLQLIQENRGILLKVCNSYCRNKNNREDLAQEIIYQLWKSSESFDGQQKFSTWMYRIALNVAISYYRKEQQSIIAVEVNDSHIDIEEGNSFEKEENSNRLQHFINELKELDRAIMLLYLEAKTYNEIADITGITETNVATKINRIKATLKERFSAIK